MADLQFSIALCLVSTIPFPFCHCRFAVPFCHSVATFRYTVAVLPFRSCRCRCGWQRKCWKRLFVCRDEVNRRLTGCPPRAERQK